MFPTLNTKRSWINYNKNASKIIEELKNMNVKSTDTRKKNL